MSTASNFDETELLSPVRETRSNAKIGLYIPPRIDAESYQAEVPAIRSNAPSKEELPIDWYGSTRAVHRPEEAQTVEVYDFLAFARNLTEDVFIEEGKKWTARSAAEIALESDEAALEYLCKLNYDLPLAKFNLMCRMSVGKDILQLKAMLDKYTQMQTQSSSWWSGPLSAYGSMNVAPNSDNMRKYISFLSDGKAELALEAARGLDDASCSGSKSIEKKQRVQSNKHTLKKKWEVFRKQLDDILHVVHGSDQKPYLADVLHIIFEASTLEPLVENPGETFMSTIHADLTELQRLSAPAKLWVANLHDLISNISVATGPDLTRLKHHLHEADSLALRCTEEQILRSLLSNMNSWLVAAKQVLSFEVPSITQPSTLVLGGNESMECCSEPERSDQKVDVLFVNDLLKQSELFPIVLAPRRRLEDIYFEALGHIQTLEEFLNKAELSRCRRPGKSSKLTEERANEILAAIERCPLRIPRAEELQSLLSECVSWRKEVAEALESDNNTISLKKVENFLVIGERLPLQYSSEMSLLRERRTMAKSWLDKLKKSFLKTSRSTRKTGGDSEKLSLEQMRDMVNEGSALYDNSQNKELKKAHEVVKEADEWVGKVRELISEVDGQSQEQLQDLLEQANCMPIALDEAEFLRAHIKALQWAERASPLLNGDDVKYNEIQKLYRDICKIRSVVNPEIDEEAPVQNLDANFEHELFVKLPEEIRIESLMKPVEQWKKMVRDLFHNGAARKGTTLEQMRNAYIYTFSLKPVNVSQQSRDLLKCINEAEMWVESNAAKLAQLGIERVTFRTITNEAEGSADEGDGGLSINKKDDIELTTGNETKMDLSEPIANVDQNVISMRSLQKLVAGAERITLDFPELRLLKSKYSEVNDWLSRVKNYCPKKALKTRSGTSIGLQKMIFSVAETFDLNEFLTDKVKSEEHPGTLGEFSDDDLEDDWDHVIPGHVCLPLLHAMLDEQKNFLVDLGDETKKLEESIEMATEWNNSMKTYLSDVFERELADSCQHYTNCVKARKLGFASLSVYEAQKAENHRDVLTSDALTEALPWKSLSSCMQSLMEHITQGESTGVYTSARLKSYAMLLAFQWISAARQYLEVSYHWGDLPLDGPRRLLEEIRVLFRNRKRMTWNSVYEDTYFVEVQEVSIDDIDDYARSRKRKRSARDGLPETDYVTSSGRMVSATRPSTPTETSNDAKDEKGVSKKRRRNTEGSASAPAVLSESITAGNSRKRGKVTSKPEQSDDDVGDAHDMTGADNRLSTSTGNLSSKLSFKCLKPFFRKGCNILPDSLLQIIDLYVRALLLLCLRVQESMKWSDKVAALIESMGKKSKSRSRRDSGAPSDVETKNLSTYSNDEDYMLLSSLMEEAVLRDLNCAKKDALRDQLSEVTDWVERSEGVISGNCTVTIEQLQQHIKAGEKIPFNCSTILSTLRSILRKSTSWISRYEDCCGEDDGNGGIKNQNIKDLLELLPASKDIAGVDLSEFTAYIERVGQVYCLCRVATHGVMIECEHCSDWYHSACLGLSNIQLEKYEGSEQFMCPRCVIVDNINSAAKNAAVLVGLWMNLEQIEKNKQMKKSRFERKYAKLQKDLQGLHAEKTRLMSATDELMQSIFQRTSFSANTGLVTAVATGTDAVPVFGSADAVLTGPGATIDAQSAVAAAEVQTNLQSAQMELKLQQSLLTDCLFKISATEGQIVKNMQECNIFMASRIVTDASYRETVRVWMIKVCDILWPETSQQIENSHPVCTDGVSVAVQEAINEAVMLGIREEADVKTVINDLEMINWYFKALCTLQAPPTSRALRRLLSDNVVQRNHHEKSVKFLNSVFSRMSSWKSKVRAYLRAPCFAKACKKKTAQVDSENLRVAPGTGDLVNVNREDISSLYLEGTTIPVKSRIVTFLLSVLEAHREEASDSAKRKKKRKDGDENATADSAIRSKVFPIPVNPADCPESSDEEDCGLVTAQASVPYRTIPDFQKSVVPKVWPIPISRLGPKPSALMAAAADGNVSSSKESHSGNSDMEVVVTDSHQEQTADSK